MKRTHITAAVMTVALLLGQAVALVHFCSVPHRITSDGHSVRAFKSHGDEHKDEGPPASDHGHEGECFALKWLTAPQTDVPHPVVCVLLGFGARVAFLLIGPSEAASSVDVLSVSPSQSPPAHA